MQTTGEVYCQSNYSSLVLRLLTDPGKQTSNLRFVGHSSNPNGEKNNPINRLSQQNCGREVATELMAK